MEIDLHEPTRTQIAAVLGLSERWVGELRARGTLPAEGATLAENIEAFYANKFEAAGGCSDLDLDAERARLTKAQADAAEMKNAQMRLELLPRADVSAAVQGAFARVRAKILALPTRAAPQVVAMPTALAVQGKLTELVHEALAELASTEVTLAEPQAEGGEGGAEEGSAAPAADAGDRRGGSDLVSGAGPAAEADGKPVGGRKSVPKPGGQRGARKVGHRKG